MEFSTYPILKNKKIQHILVIGKDVTEQKETEKILHDFEDKHRLITENTSDLIATMQFDTTYTYVNPSHKKIMGYTPKELIGKKGLDFIHPADKKRLLFLLRKHISADGEKLFAGKDSDISEVVDYRVKNKSGAWRYLESTANIIGDEILLVSKDITERKLITEETLHESEEKFKNLAEQSPNMIFINKKGKVVYANKRCEEVMGYTRKEFYSPEFDFLTLIAPESREIVKESFRKHTSGEEVLPYEYTLITKKGEKLDAIITTKLIKFEGVNAILGIVTDITERKRIEKETTRTKEYLQNIINSASECIIAITPDNRVSIWNQTMEVITGYKQREIAGKTLSTLNVFENPIHFQDYLDNIYQKRVPLSYELVINPKIGGKRLVRLTGSVIQNGGEHPIGVLLIGKDVTEDSETHGRLLPGNSYLITGKNNKSSLNLFMDLALSGYIGLLITRDRLENIHAIFPSLEVKVLMLNQDKIEGFDNVPNPNSLIRKTEEFLAKNSNTVILLDRIDYLLTNFSFETFIKALYRLTTMISHSKAIMLVRLSPSIMTERQMALIEEELRPLPSQKIEHIQLEEKLYDILAFISGQNQHNILVTYKKIGQEFSITKVTTMKRIKTHEEKGLIFVQPRGRSKTVHITEKGKMLLNKRGVL
jgi:PAS domain S-box-containing protein